MRKRFLDRKSRSAGTVTIFTVLGMSALLGVMALAIDTGFMYMTRLQLQNAADAAAVAAMRSFLDEGEIFPTASPSVVPFEMVVANEVAVRHSAGGLPVLLKLPDDVEFGFWNFGDRTFSPGIGFGSPAARVTARREEGSPGGPIGLFFARVLGRTEANVNAAAVAAIRRRDLIIVQDRTSSFADEFDDAQAADKALVDAMVTQSIAGDRLGLVTFARNSIEEAPITELSPGTQSMLESAIDAFEICPPQTLADVGGPCFGTDIAVGIDEARAMFATNPGDGNAERVMVIVSDGLPCIGEAGAANAVPLGQQLATAAADRAGDDGINIFVVTLDQGGSPTPGNPCFGGDVTFNESLARGFGSGFTTTDEADLDELLASISRSMPVRLVD